MATAVSHAMRRYHTTSSSEHKYTHYTTLRGDNTPIQSWPAPASTSDPGQAQAGALGRSMRYAEPWLCGTPVLLAAYPQHTSTLVPLCVCTEYMHGTARTARTHGGKGNVCKKCKGRRVGMGGAVGGGSVRSKYGTVRGYPTSPPQNLTPLRAGTARLTSSASRPSILPSAPIDPYDLMRRSRLTCTNDIGSQFRARSTSPNKPRGLDNRPYTSPRPKTRPRSPSPPKQTHTTRRSILECDVNPYELMSNNNEKLGLGDEGTKKMKNNDKDYEDIDVVVKKSTSQIPKLQIKIRKPSQAKKHDYSNVRNDSKFKSILKKPTVGVSVEIRSDLPNGTISGKKGSHFYLPLPALSPPRKKVQFLVESDVRESDKDYEEMSRDLQEGVKVGKDNLEVTKQIETKEIITNGVLGKDDFEDLDNEPCRLKRSLSERLAQTHTSISFNDTMALRPPKSRNTISGSGGSTLFDAVTDLQRLDGIGPTRPRPKEPPPPPPPPSEVTQQQSKYQKNKLSEDTKPQNKKHNSIRLGSKQQNHKPKQHEEKLSETNTSHQKNTIYQDESTENTIYENINDEQQTKFHKDTKEQTKNVHDTKYYDIIHENSLTHEEDVDENTINDVLTTKLQTKEHNTNYQNTVQQISKNTKVDVQLIDTNPAETSSNTTSQSTQEFVVHQEVVEKVERVATPPPRCTTELSTGYEVAMMDDALGIYEDVADDDEFEESNGNVVPLIVEGYGIPKEDPLGMKDLQVNSSKIQNTNAQNNSNNKDTNNIYEIRENNTSPFNNKHSGNSESLEKQKNTNILNSKCSLDQNSVLDEKAQVASLKLDKMNESKTKASSQNNSLSLGNSFINNTSNTITIKQKNRAELNETTTNNKKIDDVVAEIPPSAPPRKRSNSKQPITSQIIKKDASQCDKNGCNNGDDKINKINSNRIVVEQEPTTNNIEDPVNLVELRRKKEIELTEKLERLIINETPTFDAQHEVVTSKITIRSNSNSSESSINSSPDLNRSYQKVKIKPSKTIVQINSPTIQVIPSTVHRLQIKNEFPDTQNYSKISITDSPQRKTSIMINGDDCYSTVNVNDDVPIYQSSVVVNDYDSSKIEITSNNRSSSVYITGDFQTISTAHCNSPSGKFEERPKKTLVILDGTSSSASSVPLVAQSPPGIAPKSIVVLQDDEKIEKPQENEQSKENPDEEKKDRGDENQVFDKSGTEIEDKPSSEELQRLLKDPVEAVKRNLIPHVCGKADVDRKPKSKKPITCNSLVARLLEDPFLGALTEGLETNTVAKLIEDSLLKLRTQDYQDDDKDCSENESCPPYELMEVGSDCYSNHSNRSSVTEDELGTRSKFYQLLADAALQEVEEHHYECIRPNVDPIYEEIEIPPPLPANPPPSSIIDDLQIDKQFTTRSIFEGASKYDILSYLVDAKERGIVPEENYTYNFNNSGEVIVEEEETKEVVSVFSTRVSHMSTVSDSSEDSSLVITAEKNGPQKSAEVERNDSGVGSETSKCSRSRYLNQPEITTSCEDCELSVDPQPEDGPLVCRKCSKKRSERKEIITEIVETEEKYSRDLQIILEEFYQPMLVAGLLTPEQLSAIFLNVEELLENSQALAERLRDTLEIAIEQGDEDLLTVNIGKIFLEAAPMLHAFESYCVRQGPASLLLASLEKDKELLRIFLRVSQMENSVLRRMNLNSFLMVPVQRVTKYPLLLARLHKVTPLHQESRDLLREAQHKIELHLNHMNSETKDVPSRLWRRISSGAGRRSSSEMDLVNIKLRKIAVDVLEWNHDEARFALEGRLLFTQPTDNNWRKGRTIKLTPINALLVTNGKPNTTTKSDRSPTMEEGTLTFPRHTGVREAALLLVRDKGGRYSLLREPLYLDRCVIATDPAWQSYFEVQELLGKDTFIFKAEDPDMTRTWYRQLQYHAQGMGAWRKRRNALANIMINGMGSRS